jgi:5-methyltetrahydropteroyltriglutamate--homocysteine methyltransferase
MSLVATCLGYQRVGAGRELEKALEAFWSKEIPQEALAETARALRRRHWLEMKAAGVDHIPCNDFSLHDHVLDTAVMMGAVPARYVTIGDPLERLFAMARGLERAPWFDTDYHYVVPELAIDQTFHLDATKILGEIDEARALGIEPRPVVLGPVSFLLRSKLAERAERWTTPLHYLDRLLSAYGQLLVTLSDHVSWVQVDEPDLARDLDGHAAECFRRAYDRLTYSSKRPRLLLTTYFGALGANIDLATRLDCDALHIDLVRSPEQLDDVLKALAPTATLSLGVVDGRGVPRTDHGRALDLVRRAVNALGPSRVWVGPSCSLLHTPVDVESGRKLREIKALADAGATISAAATRGPRFEATRATPPTIMEGIRNETTT